MYIILTYDVGTKRVKKAMQVCRKHLNHVQKSVFEGEITEKKLNDLKESLRKVVNIDEDSICIYKTETPKNILKQKLGTSESFSNII